jgi:hypothetical protein
VRYGYYPNSLLRLPHLLSPDCTKTCKAERGDAPTDWRECSSTGSMPLTI